MDNRNCIRTISRILYIFLIIVAASGSHADESSYRFPKTIEPSAKYLFFYHNYYVEKNGPDADCRYDDILQKFTDNGFIVVSELRNTPVNPIEYAQKAVIPIRKLLDAGVPPENLTIAGHSKGAVIALQVASLLKQPEVKYVIMAGCGIKPLKNFYPEFNKIHGNILSIYAASDQIAGNCASLFPKANSGSSFEQKIIDSPAGHQLFFKPSDIWVKPVVNWVKQN